MSKLQFLIALAAASIVATVVPAAGVAGQPVISGHFSFTSDPYDATLCGMVPATAVDTVVENYKEDASGAFIDTINLTTVWTAKSTGKSVEDNVASVTKGSGPIDNGDGTISFVTSARGLVLQFKIPNGPVLKDANGQPVHSVGVLTFVDMFDAVTGDFISSTLTAEHGPHAFIDGVDVCTPLIQAIS